MTKRFMGVVTPAPCVSCRGRSPVSTGSYGGNWWHEAGADKSHPELYSRQVRTSWGKHQRPRHVWKHFQPLPWTFTDARVCHIRVVFLQDQHVLWGSDGSHGIDDGSTLHAESERKTGKYWEQSKDKIPSSVWKGMLLFNMKVFWDFSLICKTKQQGSIFPPVCSGFLQIRLTITGLYKVVPSAGDCASLQLHRFWLKPCAWWGGKQAWLMCCCLNAPWCWRRGSVEFWQTFPTSR